MPQPWAFDSKIKVALTSTLNICLAATGATIFLGRLSFSTLVFFVQFSLKVDYLSRATIYFVIMVYISPSNEVFYARCINI